MRIRNLSFSYSRQTIFEDLSVESSSSVIFLTGPPGSGKTTLLKILAGYLKPDHADMVDVPLSIGMIVQEPTLLPWLSGLENIVGLTGVSLSSLESHQLFYLIASFVHAKAFAMSYGQQRLIELIRLLILQPEVLCLDEPFNFLDKSSRTAVLDFIRSYASTSSQFVISTHSLDDLRELSGDCLIFDGAFPVQTLKRGPK